MTIDTFAMMLKIVQEQMQQLGIYSIDIDTKTIEAFVIHDEDFAKIHGEETWVDITDSPFKKVSKIVNNVEFHTYKKENLSAKEEAKDENSYISIPQSLGA